MNIAKLNYNQKIDVSKELDQLEVLIEMLIHSGRAKTNSNSFALCHDDVLVALKFIRGRVVTVSEALSC